MRTETRVLSRRGRKETAERSPGNRFHTPNKKKADTTRPNNRPATATFIVLVSVGTVAVVSKCSLLVSIPTPIRSVADFGVVNEQSSFIRGVKTVLRSGHSILRRFSPNVSGSAEHSRSVLPSPEVFG